MTQGQLSSLLAGLLLFGPARSARADGAFPDELQVFAPVEFPHRIVLGTNFGLLVSDDDGAHFDFVCEAHVASPSELVLGYTSGPGGALYAIYYTKVARSVDEGCTWTASTGAMDATRGVSDAFPDPTDGGRVAAIAVGAVGGPLAQLFTSTDLGATFGPSIYDEQNGNLFGVEYATSESGTLYATGSRIPPDAGSRLLFIRALVDGGWSEFQHPELAGDLPYLASVDPIDASELYLRIVPPSASDELGISLDRGATIAIALSLGEAMSAFAIGGDGTLYVGTESGSLWVRPAGSSFFVKEVSPKLRCLAERSGTVYGCADSTADGYALGVSTNQGMSFEPLLLYNNIRGLLACPGVEADCGAALAAIRTEFPPLPDAGLEDGGSPSSAPTPDAGSAPTGGRHSGCGCDAGSGSMLEVLALLILASRRGSRGRKFPICLGCERVRG